MIHSNDISEKLIEFKDIVLCSLNSDVLRKQVLILLRFTLVTCIICCFTKTIFRKFDFKKDFSMSILDMKVKLCTLILDIPIDYELISRFFIGDRGILSIFKMNFCAFVNFNAKRIFGKVGYLFFLN